ncbi:MAG: TetR/AcrR family transcriptional regulator [Cohnella sp.]|nr:TetR/AcrR family transcriptional regulator [Cohnella sp.]
MSEISAGRRPGRPRNEQTETRILQTARELILENGVQSFSMDSLAQRSGVSKPTIYRRWSTKEDLIMDAIGFAPDQVEDPDTGDAMKDLQLLLDEMLASLGDRIGGPPETVHRLVATIIDCPRKMARLKENFIEPRRKLCAHMIRRGKQRGQIRKDAEEEALIDLIVGAYLYGLLFRPGNRTNGDWLRQVRELLELGLRKTDKGMPI